MTVENYLNWIDERAKSLAREANRFLERLRGDLELPARVSEAEQEHAYDAA